MNVEELLQSRGISYIPKGKDFVVRCLNPDHADKNPSMRIDQIDGRFNCFACEFKGNLFALFGEKFGGLQVKRDIVTKKIREKRAESIGLSFPTNYMPYVGNWRNISPKTYAKFEAFEHTGKDFISRINFPIRDISGKIVVFQGRHTGGDTPKYLFTPPGATLPLFPQVSPRRGDVILVEGIFDMLNTWQLGYHNTLCLFGAANFSRKKLEILDRIGVTRVDILMDPDAPGQMAAKKIAEMLDTRNIISRNIKLPIGTDPGELNQIQAETFLK